MKNPGNQNKTIASESTTQRNPKIGPYKPVNGIYLPKTSNQTKSVPVAAKGDDDLMSQK